jgi:hypothetical protein
MDASTVAPTTRPSPGGRPAVNGKHVAAGALFLIAGAMTLASTVVAWWQLSIAGSGVSASVLFLPGWNVHTSGLTATPSTSSYASMGLGPVGGVYLGILALAVVTGILEVVAGVLGLIAGAGRIKRNRTGLVKGLVVSAVVLAVAAVALGPALQPWAFGDSTSNACSGLSGTTYCNSFWGSQTTSGVTRTWGATVGWYLVLGALILGIIGLLFWQDGSTTTLPTAAPSNPGTRSRP